MSTQRIRYLIEAVNKTAAPFAEAEGGIERLNKSRLEANKLVFAERRAQQYLIQVYRQKYSALYDTLGIMRDVGTIGSQVITMVNAENIAQIRLRDSLIDVEDAQRRLNTALGLFGEDSVQYESAIDDLEAANNRLKDAQNAAKTAMLGIGLQAIGTMGSIGLLILKITGETGLMGALGGLVATFGLPGIAIAITLVGLNVFHEQLDEIDRRLNITKMALEGRLGEVYEEDIGKVRPGPGYYDPDELAEDLGYDPQTGEPYDPYPGVEPGMPETYPGGGETTTNVEINIEKVESSYDVDQLWDDIQRRARQRNREIL